VGFPVCKCILFISGLNCFFCCLKVRKFATRVSTIAFGSKVSEDLEWLASATKGHTHAASSGEFGINSELLEAFLSHHESAIGNCDFLRKVAQSKL